jgi:biopolymer transport protein ExbD
LQPGIAISAPATPFLLGAQRNPQIISISGGGVPSIYFRDQKTSIERLGPLLDQAKRENRSIIIKADRQTPYELVVAVTNVALEHGISSVALAGAAPK